MRSAVLFLVVLSGCSSVPDRPVQQKISGADLNRARASEQAARYAEDHSFKNPSVICGPTEHGFVCTITSGDGKVASGTILKCSPDCVCVSGCR